MKKANVAVFLLLSVLMAFGRNITDQEVATALKRALRARDHLSETAEVQVSSALATGKDVCIEYRATTGSGQSVSGLAVYRTEDELMFLDNSWIWERACLSGKYGQRRTGKDLTSALNASLAAPAPAKPAVVAAAVPPPVAAHVAQAVAVASAPAPAVVSVQPAPVVASRAISIPASAPPPAVVQQASAKLPAPAPAPGPVPPPVIVPANAAVPAPAPTPRSAPTVASTPVPAAPAPAAVMSAAAPQPSTNPKPALPMSPRSTPAAFAPPAPATPVAVSAPPEVAVVSQPAPITAASIVPTPVPHDSGMVASNRAASVETTLHGVTIIDDNGALGAATSTVSASGQVESLADAARRVRRNQ